MKIEKILSVELKKALYRLAWDSLAKKPGKKAREIRRRRRVAA